MPQSSPSGGKGAASGGNFKTKALSANAPSFFPSSSGSSPSRPHHSVHTQQSSTAGAAASPNTSAAAASTAGAAGPSTSSPSAPQQQQQQQSQSSNGAAAPSPSSQQASSWGGLRVRTYSAGTMGTATSAGDTSAAIDHFSEYLYDWEDYTVSSQEARVAMAQSNPQMQPMQHQHQPQQQDSNISFYDDIEAEMDRDQEMADMEGLVVSMNESSGVRVGGNHAAHEYWYPECADCGCCKGYKYGCVCVQGGVNTMCKCTSVIRRANGAVDVGDKQSKNGATSAEEMDVESEAMMDANKYRSS